MKDKKITQHTPAPWGADSQFATLSSHMRGRSHFLNMDLCRQASPFSVRQVQVRMQDQIQGVDILDVTWKLQNELVGLAEDPFPSLNLTADETRIEIPLSAAIWLYSQCLWHEWGVSWALVHNCLQTYSIQLWDRDKPWSYWQRIWERQLHYLGPSWKQGVPILP